MIASDDLGDADSEAWVQFYRNHGDAHPDDYDGRWPTTNHSKDRPQRRLSKSTDSHTHSVESGVADPNRPNKGDFSHTDAGESQDGGGGDNMSEHRRSSAQALAAHDAAAQAWRCNASPGAHRLDGEEMDFITGAENEDSAARSAGYYDDALTAPHGSGVLVVLPSRRPPPGGGEGGGDDGPRPRARPRPPQRAPSLAALALVVPVIVALIVVSMFTAKSHDEGHHVLHLGTGTLPSYEGSLGDREGTLPPTATPAGTSAGVAGPLSPVAGAPCPTLVQRVYQILATKSSFLDDSILLYDGTTPSSMYRYEGFRAGLEIMAEDGIAEKYFYLGDDGIDGHLYGLANIAAFLGQSLQETIRHDACDENNWDYLKPSDSLLVYPLANACGQSGQDYQEYRCPEYERHMECAVDTRMSIMGTTQARWKGAPGPLFCGPKSKYPQTGRWDYQFDCNDPLADPPMTCSVYEGQTAGRYDNSEPVPNRNGRTEVEGCCWWGRGVIQTTGICNFGKLNYYLGKRAADEGRSSRYPDVDFCQDPGAICASKEHTELKWIAGMFYWVESLQTYDKRGWNYLAELHKFVDEGMTNSSFIEGVSGVVNRGCHDPPCLTGPVEGAQERKGHFFTVLSLLTSYSDLPRGALPLGNT